MVWARTAACNASPPRSTACPPTYLSVRPRYPPPSAEGLGGCWSGKFPESRAVRVARSGLHTGESAGARARSCSLSLQAATSCSAFYGDEAR